MAKEQRTIDSFFSSARADDSKNFKKAVTILKEIYGNPKYFNEITRTSNWPLFFECVHKMVLFEGDLFNTPGKSLKNRVMDEYILLAVKEANAHLKRDDFFLKLKQVLQLDSYDYYHHTYLSILNDYFLNQPIGIEPPTCDTWKDIINILIHRYDKSTRQHHKHLILLITRDVVEFGCASTVLSLGIKALIPFVENVLNDIFENDYTILMDRFLELAYAVYHQIGAEYMFRLCASGEKVLPDLIFMKECKQKYKVLALFVLIYRTNESILVSYESGLDNQKWRNFISEIYRNVLFGKQRIVCEDFIRLGCEVFRLHLKDPTIVGGDKEPTASSLLGMISVPDDEDFVLMLEIVRQLLNNPDLLRGEDVVTMLETVKDILLDHFREMEVFLSSCEIATALMTFLNDRESTSAETTRIQRSWMIISNMILRGIAIYTVDESNYNVLHYLVNQDNSNLNMFINSYIMKLSQLTPKRAEILQLFCKPSLWKDTDNADVKKTQLLQSLLQIPWEKVSCCFPVNKISFSLTFLVGGSVDAIDVKSLEEDRTGSVTDFIPKVFLEPQSLCLDDISSYHENFNFNLDLFEKSVQKTAAKNSPEKASVSETNKTILFASLVKLATELSKFEDTPLSTVILAAVFLLKLVTDLKRTGVSKETDPEVTTLRTLIKEGLSKVSSRLLDLDIIKEEFEELVNIFESLLVLYSKDYDDESVQTIVSETPIRVLKHLFILHKNDHQLLDSTVATNAHIACLHSCHKRTDGVRLTKRELLKVCSVRTLAAFCCMMLRRREPLGQYQLVLNILKSGKWIDLASSTDVKLVSKVLEAFSELRSEHHCRQLSVMIPLTILLFCNTRTNVCVSRFLVELVPKLFHLATFVEETSSDVKNLSILFHGFHQLVSNKSCGLPVALEFVKSLNKIIRMDQPKMANILATEDGTLLFNVFFSCLTSPFFSVRLEAARCVHLIFSSTKAVDDEWKLAFVRQLSNSWLEQILGEQCNQRNPFERHDFQLTRATSSVLTLAAVICKGNEIMQSEALYLLFQLRVKLEIKVFAKKMLDELLKSQDRRYVLENSLDYILAAWLAAESNFETFPYDLLGMASQKEFYQKHLKTILLLLMTTERHRSEIPRFFEVLGLHLEQVIELIFVPFTVNLFSNQTDEYASELLRNLRTDSELSQRYRVLLTENFHRMVICAVGRIHDLRHFHQTFKISHQRLPDAKLLSPPQFGVAQVLEVFKFLEQELGTQEGQLVKQLVTRCPDKLQQILTHFTLELNNKKVTTSWRFRVLHQYTFLCEMIGDQLQSSYFDDFSHYVIRDVSYTLFHLMKEATGEPLLANSIAVCLYRFLRKILPKRVDAVREHLNVYHSTLCKIIETGISMRILRLLLVETDGLLENFVRQVNPLPESVRGRLNLPATDDNLEKVMRRFLTNNNIYEEREVDDVFVIVDLSFLKDQLSERKDELEKMVGELENIEGLTEECTSSVIHQLIHRLIGYTRSSVEDIRLKAASCLGVLGLQDLNTMTLYPTKLVTQEAQCETNLSYQICNLLIRFLVTTNVELRKVSCEALYQLISTAPDNWIRQLPSEDQLRKLEVAMQKKHSWQLTGMEDKLKVEFIHPFVSSKTRQGETNFSVDEDTFNEVMDDRNDLWTSLNLSCEEWARQLSINLANCFKESYIRSLVPVFELSSTFCIETMPRIIYLMVRDNAARISKLSVVIDAFFSSHQNLDQKGRKIVQCMLEIVNYYRVQTILTGSELRVNYLRIAQAALSCNALFTAAMYVETWSVDFLSRHPHVDPSLPVSDHIYLVTPESGKLVHDILRRVYNSVGLSGVIYNCSSLHCKSRSTLGQYYVDTRQWDKVLLVKDADLLSQKMSEPGTLQDLTDLFGALYHLDLHQMIVTMQNLTFSNQSKASDCTYESAWRLSDWSSMPTGEYASFTMEDRFNDRASKKVNSYAFNHYNALKHMSEAKVEQVEFFLNEARESVIKDLCNISFESSATIKPRLSEMQLLKELEDACKKETEESVLQLHFDWQNQKSLEKMEYLYKEPILYQRIVVLQMNEARRASESIRDAISSTSISLLEQAKETGHERMVLLMLDSLQNLSGLSEPMKFELEFQKASNIYEGEENMEHSHNTLQRLCQRTDTATAFRARCMEACATWAAEAQTEHPKDITDTYHNAIQQFQTAADCGETDLNTLFKARLNMARFVDKEYLKLCEQLKSVQYKILRQGVENMSEIEPHPKMCKDVLLAKHYKKRYLEKDAKELETMEKLRDSYLLLAIKCYAQNLQQSDRYDNAVFRLTSLWLSNYKFVDLSELIRGYLSSIPSYKFLPLIPQLIPRLSSVEKHFAINIKILISKCAKEHPYHTLPALLATKHQFEDMKYKSVPTRVDPKTNPKTVHVARLVDDLMSEIGPFVQEYEKLSTALVMLAYYSNKSSSQVTIPRTQEITKVKEFRRVAVPTLTIDVKPDRNYDSVVSIVEYRKTFEMVGGVNAPKKVFCLGSDGVWRPQLLKGQDDMKQDAIMQQIFSILNMLLRTDDDARKSKLKIRTYKIVPLSQRSGILEWCENTTPLALILVGRDLKSGIHKKYYPKDLTAMQCQALMRSVNSSDSKVRYKTYMDMCSKFHPAFHHYFVETYQSPEIWFERKLKYTRSVAVSSMIGYVLGIGDRHLSNILFDEKTAEVVHIDFGYAFEQGKVLPTPELVPFRFTRDIEAAMGVYGAQGLMKHICTQTMRVLRQNEETILMLLEVLLYDPIYLWSTLPFKSRKTDSTTGSWDSGSTETNPGESESQKNSLAEKALWVIQKKLQGMELCIQVDVSCQVQRIIQEARDPHNLSQMYFGWQPYL